MKKICCRCGVESGISMFGFLSGKKKGGVRRGACKKCYAITAHALYVRKKKEGTLQKCVSKKTKSFRTEKERRKINARRKLERDNVSLKYVAGLLAARFKVKPSEMPRDIVRVERMRIKIKREVLSGEY